MASAYYAPLVLLPIIIVDPGLYVTRSDAVVSIPKVSKRNDHGCIGLYQDGIREHWHRSGRIYAGIETANDVVRRC